MYYVRLLQVDFCKEILMHKNSMLIRQTRANHAFGVCAKFLAVLPRKLSHYNRWRLKKKRWSHTALSKHKPTSCICIYIYTYLYAYTYVYIYRHRYVCIFICVYIYNIYNWMHGYNPIYILYNRHAYCIISSCFIWFSLKFDYWVCPTFFPDHSSSGHSRIPNLSSSMLAMPDLKTFNSCMFPA